MEQQVKTPETLRGRAHAAVTAYEEVMGAEVAARATLVGCVYDAIMEAVAAEREKVEASLREAETIYEDCCGIGGKYDRVLEPFRALAEQRREPMSEDFAKPDDDVTDFKPSLAKAEFAAKVRVAAPPEQPRVSDARLNKRIEVHAVKRWETAVIDQDIALDLRDARAELKAFRIATLSNNAQDAAAFVKMLRASTPERPSRETVERLRTEMMGRWQVYTASLRDNTTSQARARLLSEYDQSVKALLDACCGSTPEREAPTREPSR